MTTKVIHGEYQNWPWKIVVDGSNRAQFVHEQGAYKYRDEVPASAEHLSLRQWAEDWLTAHGYGPNPQ